MVLKPRPRGVAPEAAPRPQQALPSDPLRLWLPQPQPVLESPLREPERGEEWRASTLVVVQGGGGGGEKDGGGIRTRGKTRGGTFQKATLFYIHPLLSLYHHLLYSSQTPRTQALQYLHFCIGDEVWGGQGACPGGQVPEVLLGCRLHLSDPHIHWPGP